MRDGKAIDTMLIYEQTIHAQVTVREKKYHSYTIVVKTTNCFLLAKLSYIRPGGDKGESIELGLISR